MAYATVPDVERLMAQFVIGSSTKPTETQVETIIADTEQEINAILAGRRITVPVTQPTEFVGWLKLLVSYGATAAVLKSMFPSAAGPGETPAYAFWESRYKAGLKGLSDGTLLPAEYQTGIKPNTYFTRNPSSEESLGDIAEPWFKRSKQF